MEKVKVNAWFDKDEDRECWHIRIVSPDGDTIDDSRKVGFPIDVESFGEDDLEDIYDALREEYPDALIKVNGVA
ncbi:MAG: hypothetical protein HGB29_07080 [Chlorobiaceae bacterium]|nr:hypothetical protein [Chlorobiaceae bacterium]NTW74611.1 hypothetical protein [Chlorobiaceae bacterium]